MKEGILVQRQPDMLHARITRIDHTEIRVVNAPVGEFLQSLRGSDRFFVVDEQIASIYAQQLASILRPAKHMIMPAGDNSKTWDHLRRLIDAMAESGLTRKGLVVAYR